MRLNKEKVLVQLAERCMSVKDLADSYGCTKQRMYRLLKQQTTTVKTIGKLAKALNCDVKEIIDLEED